MSDQESTNGSVVLHHDSQGYPAMEAYRRLTPEALKNLYLDRPGLTASSGAMVSKARRLVEEGHVTREPDKTNTWAVVSLRESKDTRPVTYVIDHDGQCSCKAKRSPGVAWPCYHTLSVALYGWVEKALQEEGNAMFADETTQERPIGASQEGQEGTNGVEQVPQDPEMILGHPGAHTAVPQTQASVPSPCPVSPSDLTPIALPGGGQRTHTIGHLMGALARAQQRMRNPGMDSQNPHLKNRYASMAETRNVTVPVLAAEGIGLTQWVSLAAQELTCWTMLAHVSGEYQIMPVSVPCPTSGAGQSPMQVRGSAMSYAKRYGLQAAVMVVGDDDDDGDKSRKTTGSEKPGVPDMTASTPPHTTAATLRQEIETLATQQQRNMEYLWGAAERKFGAARTALTVEQLAQMLKGLTEKGAA